MYTVTRHTKKFDTEASKDLAEYDKILSNPLCSICSSWREKITDSIYDEGRLVKTETRLVLVITWEEKTLL